SALPTVGLRRGSDNNQCLLAGDKLDRFSNSRRESLPRAGSRARRQARARAGAAPGALDDFLGTAMAGAGVDRDGHRPLPRGVVAWPLAFAAASRPRPRPPRLLPG